MGENVKINKMVIVNIITKFVFVKSFCEIINFLFINSS